MIIQWTWSAQLVYFSADIVMFSSVSENHSESIYSCIYYSVKIERHGAALDIIYIILFMLNERLLEQFIYTDTKQEAYLI